MQAPPSTSGRVESFLYASPRLYVSSRSRARQCKIVCKVAASKTHWPILEFLHKLLPWKQDVAASELLVPAAPGQPYPKNTTLHTAVQKVKASAVQIGLKLTSLALRLAHMVVVDVTKTITSVRQRAAAEQPRAVELMKEAQQQLTLAAHRENLQLQGKDAAFMQMLHSLDRCNHKDLDSKWASVMKHTADKAEFSDKLSKLFTLAKQSKSAVDSLLGPDASRQEINSFWKSEETKRLIAEEAALKQLVFFQMLQAGS